jgi:hypothetical protein
MVATEEVLNRARPRSLWRKKSPLLTPDGRIERGGMWPHQLAWWNLPNFVKLFVGGYGSGKTMIQCKRGISTCLINAPVPSLIVSPTYRMAADTVVETLLQLLEGKRRIYGRERFDFDWSKTSFNFKIRYGARVGRLLVRNGDDPRRLKGSNIGCAYIDEPFIQEVGVLQQVLARCRHPRAVLKEIGMGGTPEQLNWGFDLAEGDLRNAYDVGLVRAATMDNLALPADYAERLARGYSEKMVQAFLHGQFVNVAEGLIYAQFDPSAHCPDHDDGPAESDEVFVGMDFNVNPFAFALGWRRGDHLHFFDEREMPDCDTFDACEEIKRSWPRVRLVYPDPTGRARKTASRQGSDFATLEDQGFQVRAPWNTWPRRDRFAAVNARFRDGKLTIGPRCPRLRRALAQMTYAIEHKTSGKALSHVLDAMGYAVVYQFPVGGRPMFVERSA